MQKAKIALRVLLGLIYFIFGLNFFLQFLPVPPPPTEGPMAAIMAGFTATGYLFVLIKVTEVACGLMLLTGLFVPLSLIVLAPVTLNIFLLHLIVAPEGLPMAVGLLILNVALGFLYFNSYKPLFKVKS